MNSKERASIRRDHPYTIRYDGRLYDSSETLDEAKVRISKRRRLRSAVIAHRGKIIATWTKEAGVTMVDMTWEQCNVQLF